MTKEDEKPGAESAADPREGGIASALGDLLRKTLVAGAGAIFSTEEGIRHALADLKLPKEVVNYLVQTADKTKQDVVNALSREVKSFLKDADLAALATRILTSLTFEIKTEIRFHESESKSKKGKLFPFDPKLSVSVGAKHQRGGSAVVTDETLEPAPPKPVPDEKDEKGS